MKVAELIEQIQQANPQLLAGIPPNRAAALIRTLFKHMNDTLAGTEEGVVKFAGLGQFRVKRVEKEVDGAKVATKRILFVASKPVDEATIQARKAKQAESQSAS
jgi:nucleoid DNA-binding protein